MRARNECVFTEEPRRGDRADAARRSVALPGLSDGVTLSGGSSVRLTAASQRPRPTPDRPSGPHNKTADRLTDSPATDIGQVVLGSFQQSRIQGIFNCLRPRPLGRLWLGPLFSDATLQGTAGGA